MSTNTTIPMRTPGELASAAPYIMGFTPEKSILIVTMEKTGDEFERGLVMRMDIPSTIQDLDEGLDGFRHALTQTDGASRHALVIMVDDITPDGVSDMPHREYVDQIHDMFASENLQSVASIYTDGASVGMYDSPTFTSIRAHERDYVAAHYVYAGIAPLDSRNAYAQVISYTENLEVEATIEEHIARYAKDQLHREEVIPVATGILRTLTQDQQPSNDDISQIAASLHNIYVRDVVLYDMSTLDANTRTFVTANLRSITANTPDAFAAPVATTLAINEWLAGDGARTNMATDRALASDRDYSLNQLIRAAVGNGIPPQFWQESITDLTREHRVALGTAPPSAGKTHQHEPLTRVSAPAASADIAL